MESRVIFYDGMDNDPEDYNNLQEFVQDSFDDAVADGITSARKYSGFVASITGAAEMTVTPGRLYASGKVFKRPESFVKDFTLSLPNASKKNVLLVVFGTEVDTDSRAREFLINEETGASEPRVVPMERRRVCNINVAAGTESPDPLDPVLDAGVLPIARIVLSPTGITSVTMLTDNKLDSVASVAGRVDTLESFRDIAAPQIVSLSSDLAALGVRAGGNVGQETYGRMLSRLAVLEAKSGIPSAAVDSSADFFLDAATSDTTNVAFVARVDEGIRFADEAVNETALSVFDTLNPRAKIVGGVLFPSYARDLRMAVGPRQSEVQVAAYSYQSNEVVEKTMSRTRIRYGDSFTVCSNTAWWQSGKYDYNTKVFTKDGETFNITNATLAIGPHDLVRAQKFWTDTYREPYWDLVSVNHTVPGVQVAETFLNANDMWLDAVGLTFTKLATTGGITLAICNVSQNGTPDLKSVISYTTVDRSALSVNSETVISLQPAFLKGGTRYALVVITAADHWLATTAGSNFPQGTFFYVLDGAYQQGDATRDLVFNLYAAKFSASRAVIEMSPLSLSGGITELDILADSIVPESSVLSYEVQVGSVWTPIQSASQSILSAGGTIPPLVPLRLVFTGTPDVMPAVRLTGSRVRVSRPKVTLTHISTVRTLPAPSTSIRVVERLESFDALHHTAVVKLLSGAGYTTSTNASSSTSVTNEDGTIERTWLFNLGSAVSTYKIRTEATTDSALLTFHFGWRKDYAL